MLVLVAVPAPSAPRNCWLRSARSPDPASQLAIQIVDLLGHRPRELGDQTSNPVSRCARSSMTQ